MTMQDLGTFMTGFFEAVWDLLGVPLIFGYSARHFIVFAVVATLSIGSIRLLFGIGSDAGAFGARVHRSRSRGGE